jgi:hypothetical protein
MNKKFFIVWVCVLTNFETAMSVFQQKKNSNGNHTLKSLKSLFKAYFLLGEGKGLCASVNSKAMLVAG